MLGENDIFNTYFLESMLRMLLYGLHKRSMHRCHLIIDGFYSLKIVEFIREMYELVTKTISDASDSTSPSIIRHS